LFQSNTTIFYYLFSLIGDEFQLLDHHQAILIRNFKNRLHVVYIKFNITWDPTWHWI